MLQKSLDPLAEYCDKWKLIVNAQTHRGYVFRKREMSIETNSLVFKIES